MKATKKKQKTLRSEEINKERQLWKKYLRDKQEWDAKGNSKTIQST